MLPAAERLRDRSWLANALWINATLVRLVGDWRAARAFIDHGLGAVPQEPRLLCTRAIMEYAVGDFGQGEAYMERLLDVMRRTPPGPSAEYT